MSVNKVHLVGRLGRDPEVRTTQSGQDVCSFSIATERRYKDRSGNRQKQSEWHNLVAWGRTAQIVGQYLTKGSQIHVLGRLQTRSWDDRNSGEKKYRTEVIVEELTMLGGGRQRASGQGNYTGGGGAGHDFDAAPDFDSSGGGHQPAAASGGQDFNSSGSDFNSGDGDDDDIPF